MKRFYPFYVAFIFFGFFLILFPFMFIFVHFNACRNVNHWIYRIWGLAVYFFGGIRWNIVRKAKFRKHQNYIFCANHTSYIDIPALYVSIHKDVSFIGKSSLGKVPLFGYIYSRIHILVDRRSKDSKVETLERSKKVLDQGGSLIIFPEGTIPKEGNRPNMIDFKDGAFKLAIEKGVPIVPVTMPYNYIILPDDNKLNARRHECKIVFHEPLETKDLTLNDINTLKQKTYSIISAELDKHKINLNQ